VYNHSLSGLLFSKLVVVEKPPDGCRQVMVGYFLPGDAAFLSRARVGGGYQTGTGYHSPLELKCADITGKSGANEQAINLF
jgi:hypothetical protein